MRTICSFLAFSVISLFTANSYAQVQWIADAPFKLNSYNSLYNMLEDGKPVVIAVGDIHAQSSELMLASGTLQKLTAEHEVGKLGERFSAKDLHVAFVDIQVMATESGNSTPKALQVVHMNEDNEALNSAGWQELYSIAGTHLFLVTPDHLVRPLHGTTADEIVREVAFVSSKVRPSATPDLRLLDATINDIGNKALIRVQNFSTTTVRNIQISIMKDGKEISQTAYNAAISSLEDAVVSVSMPIGADAGITIVAKVAGDNNPLNNSWIGAPRSLSGATMIAGVFTR